MKIAVLGGGITGLVAMNKLLDKGHSVFLFEAGKELGGLAGGFRGENWEWPLERAYHHIFSSDRDILEFAREIGFGDFFFSEPQTASLYQADNNYRIIPVDTPQDFLRFPLLSMPIKIRSAAVLAFLKMSPFFSLYEKTTAAEFLKKGMGERAWDVLWKELFRKKFGKYAEKIIASFIWTRVKKRTKSLGYPRGGFQGLIDFIGRTNKKNNGVMEKEARVERVEEKRGQIEVYFKQRGEEKSISFDVVLSTLPTPVLLGVSEGLFPQSYVARLKKIKYLNAVNLIFETKEPLLTSVYWLNICDKSTPIMGLIQHTNLIETKYYDNHHLLYAANYVDDENILLSATKEEIIKRYLPHLLKLNKHINIINTYLFRAPFAQPIFDRDFPATMPEFETPNKKVFIANLDMTYPNDRGTNYAVRLGKEAAGLI